MDSNKIFEVIYNDNIWNDPFSRSGSGSNLEQTEIVRIVLPTIIQKYNIQSLLDIPCGDFFWMKEIQPQLRKILKIYVGGDIVEEIVRKNNEHFADSIFSFKHLELQNSILPISDLVFCRDCLVHLSYNDILKSFINIKKSKNKYLLTTTFPRRKNRNIYTGAWRPINLQKFPFYFPNPLEIYSEQCSEFEGEFKDKSLALWEIHKISLFRFKLIIHLYSIYYTIKSVFKTHKPI